MALTDEEIQAIRDEIGDSEPPSDLDLQDIYDRKGESLTLTAITVLNKRIVELASGGALSFTVVGEYGENSAANIKALQDQIARIEHTGIGDEGPLLGKVTVGNIGRRWGR